MRILSLLGSPRANGTTHSMARLIAGGLSGGGPVEEIALQEKHIRPCRGCQSCDAAPHVCPLARTDDAEAIFAAIAAADVVLWTSPVYFYGLPAQAKALVDRSQRIWAGVEAGRPAGKGPLVLAALAAARPRGEQLLRPQSLRGENLSRIFRSRSAGGTAQRCPAAAGRMAGGSARGHFRKSHGIPSRNGIPDNAACHGQCAPALPQPLFSV